MLVALVSGGWAIAWAAARLLIVSEPLGRADAIVVLSGSLAFEEGARLAATLYKEGRAPMIILTNDDQQGGWSATLQRNPFYWERAVNFLQRSGVPRESVEVLTQPVDSTYKEAMVLRHYCQTHGLRSAVVVTSAYHSRRARWTLHRVLEKTGVTIAIAAVPAGQDTATWWLHSRGWSMVAVEYLKIIYYRLVYSQI